MAQKIRIATFNCENLFSRPTIFRQTNAASLKLLDSVSKLRDELSKPVFDQAKIKKLKSDLAGYASVNDIRLKHTKAGTGSDEWIGWIEFDRAPADAEAVNNTARVISDVDADIICLIEVENRTLLQKFHDQILYKDFLKPAGKDPYGHIMLIDGNDDRGIDVSVMSRYPIECIKSHIDDTASYLGKTVKTFSRDCLHVQLDINAGKPLNLFINHLKSQGYSDKRDPQGEIRRKGQAEEIIRLISMLDLKNDYIVVAGDMNADSKSPSLEPLLTNPDLYNVNLSLPVKERGTYMTGSQQLDYILVNLPLKQKIKSVNIERRGIYTARSNHYPTVTARTSEASDHAAVVAEFLI